MYAYLASLLCDECGEKISAELAEQGHRDEGDSDGFPQQVPEGETDSPNHCEQHDQCLTRIDLVDYGLKPEDELIGSESRFIGALLGESFTEDGIRRTYDMVTEQEPTAYQRALHRLWRTSYPVLVDRIENSARRQGIADGKGVGSWVIDGNTSEETARRILQGLEDGDPEIIDGLPSGPLSGEWADGLLPRDVLGWYGLLEDDDEADDVLRAYEDGWSEGMVDEVERAARALVPTVESLLEEPAAGCDAVASLYQWSTNYDAGKGPITLLLDLIGWSEDELGETLYDLSSASLGYLELSKLAAALSEYAERPHEVRAYVDQLLEAESE